MFGVKDSIPRGLCAGVVYKVLCADLSQFLALTKFWTMQDLCSKDCFSILDHAFTTLQLYQRSHSYSMGKTYTKSSTLSCLFKTFLAIFYIIMFPFVLYSQLAFCTHYTFNSVLTQSADDRRKVFFKKNVLVLKISNLIPYLWPDPLVNTFCQTCFAISYQLRPMLRYFEGLCSRSYRWWKSSLF